MSETQRDVNVVANLLQVGCSDIWIGAGGLGKATFQLLCSIAYPWKGVRMSSHDTQEAGFSRIALRHFSKEPPGNWNTWGSPVSPAGDIWTFPVKDAEYLKDLVETLVLHTPPHILKDTLVLNITPANPYTDLLSVLSNSEPLRVLHTRLHHPWIMENLDHCVTTHFQPIVDLLKGGSVFGYEALCRIQTPQGVMLNGFEAFRVAKTAFRTEALDLASVRCAISSKAKLLAPETPLFVNLLPHSLLNTHSVVLPFRQFLAESGLSPQEIVIELVESEQVNPESLLDACEILREMGFRIALDDIGTGYNSLNTLATLQPDFVKLERGLVHGIQGSRVRMVLLEAIISMAQRLGCATVAEGLEDVEDVKLCQEVGIHYAQGYFFAPPGPVPVQPSPVPMRPAPSQPFSGITLQLSDFVDALPTVSTTETVASAQSIFVAQRELPHIVVLDGRNPIGYVTRSILAERRGHRPVVGFSNPITRILKDNISKWELVGKLYNSGGAGQPWIVVDDHNAYLGALDPSIVLPQLVCASDKGEVHPLSLLPTGPVLRSTLDLFLQAGKDVLLIYIDIDNFKAFNDRYGFIKGDAMIKLVAEIICHQRTSWKDAYLGHIGGDDFIVIAPDSTSGLHPRLERIIESFQQLSTHLYDAKDLQSGFFVTEDGNHYPVAALSIIVLNGKTGWLSDSLRASERAAQLKKIAKAERGSAIVIEGNPPMVIRRDFHGQREAIESHVVHILGLISQVHRGRTQHDLDEIFKAHPYFELIYELDRQGVQRHPNWVNPRMRGRIKGGGVGVDRSARAYFSDVLEARRPFMSDIYLSTASGDFCVTLSVPLFDQDREFDGVLVADINLPGLVTIFTSPDGLGQCC